MMAELLDHFDTVCPGLDALKFIENLRTNPPQTRDELAGRLASAHQTGLASRPLESIDRIADFFWSLHKATRAVNTPGQAAAFEDLRQTTIKTDLARGGKGDVSLEYNLWRLPPEMNPDHATFEGKNQRTKEMFRRRTRVSNMSTTDLLKAQKNNDRLTFCMETVAEYNWSHMMSESFFSEHPDFVEQLRQRLKRYPLIELGVGNNSHKHRALFRDFFDVPEYLPVDFRPRSDSYVAHEDMLTFLERQSPGSANVVAFGVFNEPLTRVLEDAESMDEASCTIQFEYVNRLARELHRVLPAEGILFGDGHRIARYFDCFETILIANRLIRVEDPFKYLATKLPIEQRYVRDPFFFCRG